MNLNELNLKYNEPLFFLKLGMDYVILLWHSLSLPYTYFDVLLNLMLTKTQ